MPNFIKSFMSLALSFIIIGANDASAQTLPEPLQVRPQIDGFGVDVVQRRLLLSGLAGVSIGQPGAGGLSFSWVYADNGWRHSALGTLSSSGTTYTVSLGSSAETFTKSGSVYTSDQGGGASLTEYPTGFIYDDRNGVEYWFVKAYAGNYLSGANKPNEGVLARITYPSGDITRLNYEMVTVGSASALRLQSMNNNLGYQIHFYYASNSATQQSHFPEWRRMTKATAFNRDVDPCNIFNDACSFSKVWPSVTYTGAEFRIDTATNIDTSTGVNVGETKFAYNSDGLLINIRPPGTGTNIAVYEYTSGPNGQIISAESNGATWNYSETDDGTTRTTTITGPASLTRIIKSDMSTGLVESEENAASEKTAYLYDGSGRLTRITAPEENYVEYTYDTRGNVTQTKQVAKPGSGDANIITSAVYPASCSNPVTCNKPTSATDALGNITYFTYDAAHGGLTSALSPPDGNGLRQKVSHTYSTDFTYSKGGIVYTVPVWRRTKTATCSTAQACAGLSAEHVTEITYSGPHVLPTSVTMKTGAGGYVRTVSTEYDDLGDVTSIDGPLSGALDKVHYYYDELRRPIGVIGPDPDGVGLLKHRASRTIYNARGVVDEVRQGTTTGASKTMLLNMSVLQHVEFDYDGYFRQLAARRYADGTLTSVVQTSYDAVSRPQCTAIRQKLTGYPSDACTFASSSTFGPDRISKNVYDNVGRLEKVQTGFGSSAARWEIRNAFTANGRTASVRDADNNWTNYTYDGHDRLSRTTFPGGSYEELTYNAASNVTALRLRDAQSIGYAYDDRGRLTLVNAPGGAPNDITYSYDVMGRLTQASTGWHDADYAYNIHGQVLSETTLTGATSYLYDAAGRRTRMTWSDNYYVTYDYDTAGALIDILEYGSTSLAAFSYDDLGRRTTLTRGNGTETHWRYDGADSKGRLDEVEQDLSGSANDLVFGFGYSPAGQIVSRVSDNDRYDFDELSNITITSLANALNQLTSIGSATPTHDNRGNMTSDGTNSYGYDTYNRMTSAPGSASFIYDPQGRLLQASKTGLSTRRFGYDGAEIIGEYSSSNVLATRYVRGPAADEVLVEVDAASGSKTWLHHDERGSVIAGSGPTGAQTFINTYDEYGKPGVLNEGSFQYTGQLYLEETEASGSGSGLYYYKARIYNPDLGRFMQTDPIGYGDGLNMYNYVGSDPVNFSDPGGLSRGWDPEDNKPIDCPSGNICVYQTRRGPSFNDLVLGMFLQNLLNGNVFDFSGGVGEASDGGGDGSGEDDDDGEDGNPSVECSPAPGERPTNTELNFNPTGPSQRREIWAHPFAAWGINGLRHEANQATRSAFGPPNVANGFWHGSAADGFRHAFASYRITQEYGGTIAKHFGDAHERLDGYLDGYTYQDLYNNKVGRELAERYGNEMSAYDAITQAQSSGCIRNQPF